MRRPAGRCRPPSQPQHGPQAIELAWISALAAAETFLVGARGRATSPLGSCDLLAKAGGNCRGLQARARRPLDQVPITASCSRHRRSPSFSIRAAPTLERGGDWPTGLVQRGLRLLALLPRRFDPRACRARISRARLSPGHILRPARHPGLASAASFSLIQLPAFAIPTD